MWPPPARAPIIRISKGTFYRHHPGARLSHPNPALFPNLDWELPSTAEGNDQQHWCIVGPSLSGKTTFLQVLRGEHLCIPPTARSYPYLSTDAVLPQLRTPARAIQYVGFGAGSSSSGLGPTTSAYLAARYESRRENTDFSLRDFLRGDTELNPADKDAGEAIDDALMDRVVRALSLAPLLDLPAAFLSNGQGRRARIARALLRAPEVLLLDEPFMGLDPPTVVALSPFLRGLAEERDEPRLVLSARPQDPLPGWISHLVYLRTDCSVAEMGRRDEVVDRLRSYVGRVVEGGQNEDPTMPVTALMDMGRTLTEDGVEGQGFGESARGVNITVPDMSGVDGGEKYSSIGEPLVEMDGCQVWYGEKIVLGNWHNESAKGGKKGLIWTVRRGERWGVFGPNGSGKTTIMSLLSSDHPQTYSLPIKLFGKSRLPEPWSGELPLTFWDIQSRVGHSSPELHTHMPRHLTIRKVIQSAWADTFISTPTLDTQATGKVDASLRWFRRELDPAASGSDKLDAHADLSWADEHLFGSLSFSAQRVLLLIRAVIKNPDIVVLDEAFSGMDESVRDKCMLFIAHGEEKMLARSAGGDGMTVVNSGFRKTGDVNVHGLMPHQAFICISHVKEEVPGFVREWLCLPEAASGKPARFGRLDGPLRLDGKRWDAIWGLGAKTT